MAFKRKHYVILAQLISKLPKGKEKDTLVDELATMFKNDNAYFDRSKFFKACGYSNDEIGNIFGVKYATESISEFTQRSSKLVSLLKESPRTYNDEDEELEDLARDLDYFEMEGDNSLFGILGEYEKLAKKKNYNRVLRAISATKKNWSNAWMSIRKQL
jgi:hypothetical protein